MYLTWCSAANQSPSSRGYIRDWVALHAGGAFADHVAWVRSEIDARGPALAELPAGAHERAVRTGFEGGDRFPRRRLRCLRQRHFLHRPSAPKLAADVGDAARFYPRVTGQDEIGRPLWAVKPFHSRNGTPLARILDLPEAIVVGVLSVLSGRSSRPRRRAPSRIATVDVAVSCHSRFGFGGPVLGVACRTKDRLTMVRRLDVISGEKIGRSHRSILTLELHDLLVRGRK